VPPPKNGTYTILEAENLTIEDVSRMIAEDTFSVWEQDCFLAKRNIEALQGIYYVIAHRYSTATHGDPRADRLSAELVNSTVVCLDLIRPTRKSRAGKITGSIKADGMLQPQGFDVPEPAEVPPIQRHFSIRNRDIDTLRTILPEFLQLYPRDAKKDEYEPLRMAVQLYQQAYAIHYWKARHILWWSSIEALYGNAETAATARIYAFLGNRSLIDGYRCSIYEKGDIPSFHHRSAENDHTLGEMVPLIYEVRNASAHGQKVPDSHFSPVPHPFGEVPGLDSLAEAATFIIRKTVVEILRRGFRERFKDRDAREDFWLREHGLNGKQSKKRLNEMRQSLELERR
jgi:hypothetical protein